MGGQQTLGNRMRERESAQHRQQNLSARPRFDWFVAKSSNCAKCSR
jgi:hypothetical protein